MQTHIDPSFQSDPDMPEAESILRACVHCGFCTATCPTYQVLGDELESPRGRIYLIREFLSGHPATLKSLEHLDRCLGCRACETTCPSGVRYGRLLEIGRSRMEQKISRPVADRAKRLLLRKTVPHPARLRPLLKLAGTVGPWIPPALRKKIPPAVSGPSLVPRRERAVEGGAQKQQVLVLAGCVQSVSTPATVTALETLLGTLGIRAVLPETAGCCGALSLHLGAGEEAREFMRHNIDAWWPHVEAGAGAILVPASGCGLMVREYAEHLRHDPAYAQKAATISGLAQDPGRYLLEQGLASRLEKLTGLRIAFHAPCTLQHGLKVSGAVETLLESAGHTLTHVPDSHLCCGSAGAYSLLQPELSHILRQNRIGCLTSGTPEVIATANIGCQLHLQAASPVPVRHWLELLLQETAENRESLS